jgi:hypothetical protein
MTSTFLEGAGRNNIARSDFGCEQSRLGWVPIADLGGTRRNATVARMKLDFGPTWGRSSTTFIDVLQFSRWRCQRKEFFTAGKKGDARRNLRPLENFLMIPARWPQTCYFFFAGGAATTEVAMFWVPSTL